MIIIDTIFDIINIPVIVVRYDLTVINYNRIFSMLLGSYRDYYGKSIEDIELFIDIRIELTEAVLGNKKKRLHVYHGDSVYELRIEQKPVESKQINIIYLIDVTRFINTEKELLRKNKELMIANSISNIFISSSEINEIYSHILEKCMLIGDFGLGCIVMPIENNNSLLVKAQGGFSIAFQRDINIGRFDHIIKSVEPPMRVFKREEIERHDLLNREGIFFLVIVPLISRGTALGYLILGSRKEKVFDLDLASVISMIANNVSLVFDKIRLFREMERLSITDALTELFNRRYFYNVLKNEIERVKRYNTPFSIVLMDIDNFKKVNDEHGHLAGDRVLQVIADILKRFLRKVDIIARYGGEEFILLLPNTTKEEARFIANRIREKISKTIFECLSDEGLQVVCPVTISGGITTCPDDFIDPDRLLNAADKAMYEAKALGKNRIVLFHK